MPIVYHNKTDLFEFADEKNLSIAHGCNTKAAMFSGVAKIVKEKYPHVNEIYEYYCHKKLFHVGSILPVTISYCPDRYIYNLATQENPGCDAKKEHIVVSVSRMFYDLSCMSIKEIAIPKIGCGIGGLNWDDDVEPILDFLVRHVYDNKVTVHVCSLE